MLNQLLKFTLASSVLLWLRPRWQGLLALTVVVLLVHIVHGEYLSYVELSGENEFLLASYVVKWVALIVALLAYYFFAIRGLGSANPVPVQDRTAPASSTADSPASGDDGFDFLRNKKELESEAQKLLAGKESD